MDTARIAFLKAIKNFPRWMDIQKRPQKATGSKLLQAIMDEQDNFKVALDKFKSDFFLLSYVGREDTILSEVYVYQVGEVDASTIEMVEPALPVTEEPRTFMDKPDAYVFYQDGYIMLSTKAKGKLKNVLLTINDYRYGGKLTRMPVWNIFDEFAMFLSLERFDEESNKELMHRCFAAFKNPTNSTEQGLKNAIINTVTNIYPLSADDISIEKPSLQNVYEQDSTGEEIYEKLAQLNQDIFRTKKWDMDTWEHGFKQLDFFPHVWDAPIEIYQDGVGQMDDLKVTMSNDLADAEKTDVEVTGYEADTVAINSYILGQNIKKEIPLKLEKYKNELKPKKVQYKITATPVKKIEKPQSVYLKSMSMTNGESEQYLEDIVTSPEKATIIDRGKLVDGHSYKLTFHARTPYSDMTIDRISLTSGGKEQDLIKETEGFKKVDGTLKSVDVLCHVDEIKELHSSTNIINNRNGLQLDTAQPVGDMYVDVTGMGGNYVTIGHSCDTEDITLNRSCVKSNGFVSTASGTLLDQTNSTASTIQIDVEGCYLSFDYRNPTNMGSCAVQILVNGKPDLVNSGLWTSARSFAAEYDRFSKISVRIAKAGIHPIEIANVKAKRYKIETDLQNNENQTELIYSTYGTILPSLNKDTKNLLHVRLTNLGTKTPVINYIHVGSPMDYVSYTVDPIQAGANTSLDIRTNCRVELYDKTDERIVNDDYTTRALYRNNTSEDVYIGIDTSNFVSIKGSSRKIENTTKNGRSIKCIRLRPGEEAESIVITGTAYKLISATKLSVLLNLKSTDEVYACRSAKGFVVRNTSTKEEKLVTIPRNKFSSASETIVWEGLSSDLTGVFVIDEAAGKLATGSRFDRNFECLYAVVNSDEEYTAYNDVTMFQNTLQHVELINTFAPLLDITKLMYYEIADVVKGNDKSTSVKFMKPVGEPTNWSLGIKSEGLQIQTDMGYDNSASYGTDMSRLNEAFTISNHIDLPHAVLINGEEMDLARYIVTPPDDMDIIYEDEIAGENGVIIEADGFNKLYYSNVKRIEDVRQNGVSLLKGKYKLLMDDTSGISKEGIILWLDPTLKGQSVDIIYTYKRPIAITYKSLSSLYDLVGYSVDAYRKINSVPLHLLDLHDGDKKRIEFGDHKGKVDKILVRCSNPNFQAVIESNDSSYSIKVKRVSKDNVAIVNTGYYYDDGTEYYFFNNLHTENIDRMSGVELFHVKRYGDTLVFTRRSTNYLKDSAFSGKREEILCDIECKNNLRIDGVSQLQSITACDSYNMWQAFNMKVELKDSVHNLGIHFEPTNEPAYAIMDISSIVYPGAQLSFAATSSLKTFIMKEHLADGDSLQKSTFADPVEEIKGSDGYRSYRFPDKVDDVRYYLMAQGAGLIDDIVARPYDEDTRVSDLHKKNIEAIGFSIDEPMEPKTKVYMGFDTLGNVLDGLDITKAGNIITGSNVDWGLTKIYDVSDDMERCWTKNVKLQHGAFYSEEKTGTVRTLPIFIENQTALRDLYIKVNDVLIDKMTDYTIRAYTASNSVSAYQQVQEEYKTNLMMISGARLTPYLQIEVDIPVGSVINTIEIYARYAETEDTTPRVIPNNRGTIITKVYDTAYAANYKLAQIDGSISSLEDVELYVRGCRRDTSHEVWTKWYQEKLNEDLTADMPHLFENYQLFQFKFILKDSKAECSIKNFVLEVV